MRFWSFVFLLLLIPSALMAEGISARTGFIDGPIWFSEEFLKVEDKVKIYTAVFNAEDSRLVLKVDFVDDDTVISSKDVIVSPNETKTISADWKVSLGSHQIFAIISSSKIDDKQVILERVKTSSVKFSTTKDVPANLVKNAISSKFSSVIKTDGNFIDKVDSWFKLNFVKSEEFREEKLTDLKKTKEDLSVKIEKEKDSESRAKIVSKAYLFALIAVVFIFSVSIAFYICLLIIFYIILRTIWKILKRIFRKKHEE